MRALARSARSQPGISNEVFLNRFFEESQPVQRLYGKLKRVYREVNGSEPAASDQWQILAAVRQGTKDIIKSHDSELKAIESKLLTADCEENDATLMDRRMFFGDIADSRKSRAATIFDDNQRKHNFPAEAKVVKDYSTKAAARGAALRAKATDLQPPEVDASAGAKVRMGASGGS